MKLRASKNVWLTYDSDVHDQSMSASQTSHPRFLRSPRVMVAAGGTGGHVYPAIAVADALRCQRKDVRLAFVGGDPPREEQRAMPRAGYGNPWKVPSPRMRLDWTFPWKFSRALFCATWHVLRFRPDVIIGTGGYVAAPTCIAAALLQVPMLLVEPNARPGKTNRWLSRFAKRVCVAFPEAVEHLPRMNNVLVVGTPTRKGMKRGEERDKAKEKEALMLGNSKHKFDDHVPMPKEVVCVFGGSLGAARINQAVVDCLPDLMKRNDVFVLWQTGPAHHSDVMEEMLSGSGLEPPTPEALSEQSNGFLPIALDAQDLKGIKYQCVSTSSDDPKVGHNADEKQSFGAKVSIVPFVNSVDVAYASADVVIARAGAITCAELLAAGVPSVLIPAPNVAEDHQTFNARAMEGFGASIMIRDRDLDSGALRHALINLLDDKPRLHEMAQNASKAAKTDAADTIAKELLLLAATHQRKLNHIFYWPKTILQSLAFK